MRKYNIVIETHSIIMKKTEAKLFFSNFLRERGFRVTKERSAILQKTLSCKGHFDPESLYLQIRATGLKASRASIYRTIGLLCECGLIGIVKKTEHGTIYENTFGNEHHDHMLCTQCGNVIEFYSEELERLQEALCKNQGSACRDRAWAGP